MMKAKKNNVINYNEILSERNSNSYSMSIDIFHYEIQQKWIESYKQFTTSLTNIVSFDDGDFTYLFDYSIELVNAGKISVEECVDARVVVAYGLSKKPVTKRDTSRMKGFLGNFSKLFKNASYDKGHFIGHAIGGNLDVNLFPQLTKINRGWSENGKRFRSMENYCSKNIGTFCFSRPIYNSKSWVPFAIEYGILIDNKNVWAEIFENNV